MFIQINFMIHKKVCFPFFIFFVLIMGIIVGNNENFDSSYDAENKELFESYDSDEVNDLCTDNSLDDLLKKLDETAQLQIFENEAPKADESEINELRNELSDEMIHDIYQKNLIQFDNGTFEPDEYQEDDNVMLEQEENKQYNSDYTSDNDCAFMGSFDHKSVINEIVTIQNNLGVMSENITKMKEQLEGLVNQYNAYDGGSENNQSCEPSTEDICEMQYHTINDKMQEMKEYEQFLTMIRDAAILEWLELADGKKQPKRMYAMRTHEKIKNKMPQRNKKKRKKEQYNRKKYSVSQCADCMQNHTNGCSKCRFNKK